MTLKITKKILYFGRVFGLASKTVNRRTYSGNATCYLGGCVIVIGNGLDLGNGVSRGSLYNVKDGPAL